MVDVYSKASGKVVHVFEIKDKVLSLLSSTPTKLFLLAQDVPYSPGSRPAHTSSDQSRDEFAPVSKKPLPSSIIQIMRTNVRPAGG
jgi:hypothetical protein